MNGEERTSTSNRIALDRIYEVQLTGVSSEEGETASIGLKTDVESLTENINTLVQGYNTFLTAVFRAQRGPSQKADGSSMK